MKKRLVIILALGLLFAKVGAQEFKVKPYLQYATKTSMRILFETEQPTKAVVRYGNALPNAKAPNLSLSVSDSDLKTMHEVELVGLEVETNYFWQVDIISINGNTISSEVSSFKTNVKDNTAFAFALVGDSQRNQHDPKDSIVWRKISEKVWNSRPNFVVHVGDLVDDGLRITDWTEQFLPEGHQLMRRIPMYTALGNHENDSEYYYQYMANPKPEYYYSFTYGNAEFFVIDTNRDVTENSEQYNWLEQALAKSTATWKITMHHHPPYSSEENDNGDTYKGLSTYGVVAIRDLVPLYERYGVDFCLYGHVHMYERTWPIKNNMVDQENGVVYINSGGAGGPIEGFAPTRNWFSLEQRPVHHYCTFTIFDKTVVFKAIDMEGRLFDTFQMTKEDDKVIVQPPAPILKITDDSFFGETSFSMEGGFDNLEIYYTLDGNQPTKKSKKYTEPISIKKTTVVKAIAVDKNGNTSRVLTRRIVHVPISKAVKVGKLKQGIEYNYYEGAWTKLPNFKKLPIISKGEVKNFNIEGLNKKEDSWGLVFNGYYYAANSKVYNFFTRSDDGSQLLINDIMVVDNDGDHSMRLRKGGIYLEKGYHKIEVRYFDNYHGHRLETGLFENGKKSAFSSVNLFRD
ncbi:MULTISPECIES: metallophosphoesterase [Flavobacteriaceae]|uniref:metallophosphoesterase n=1 Tax=Flavobacteriaceae TaxID=49546 RepID=UPI001492A4EF|nr:MULTISPECIES: metallophosphoesterase [Allomuricauda]MDC6364895.1 metallophosphoesterase [Muricauda sp. AC10]